MIGWLGFVGRLLEFTASKIVGRQLDVTLDRKKRACRDMLEMYDLLDELEAFASHCVSVLDPVADGRKPRLYSPALRELDKRGHALSERFIDRLEPLSRAFEILEPNLGGMFSELRHLKLKARSSFWLSDVFRENFQTHRLVKTEGVGTCLEVFVPRVDPFPKLEAKYGRNPGRPIPLSSSDVLLALVTAEGITSTVVEPEDVPAIQNLRAALREHAQRLSKTRSALGAFISQRFSIEDLLYVGRNRSEAIDEGGH